MGKKIRRVPEIKVDNQYIVRHEHAICVGEGCRNAVEVPNKPGKRAFPVLCSLCRRKMKS